MYGPQQTKNFERSINMENKENVREYLNRAPLDVRIEKMTTQMALPSHLREKKYQKKEEVELLPITEDTLLEYQQRYEDPKTSKMPRFIRVIKDDKISRRFINGEVYEKLLYDQELANQYINE